jgi:hypothetical protein
MGNVSLIHDTQKAVLILFRRHVEGVSTCFGTGLNYVALRVLGVDAEHPVCVRARACLHKLGASFSLNHLGGKFRNSRQGVLLLFLHGENSGYPF